MIFLRKIVIFHTKYLRRDFFKCASPNLKSWIRPWWITHSTTGDPSGAENVNPSVAREFTSGCKCGLCSSIAFLSVVCRLSSFYCLSYDLRLLITLLTSYSCCLLRQDQTKIKVDMLQRSICFSNQFSILVIENTIQLALL